MGEKLDIIAIGEGLVELSTENNLKDAECLQKYYGGDVLATAVAAKRSGSKVGFITKLGDDAFKDYLLESWKNEGLDVSNVTLTNERNGLYLIARPTYSQKEFAYYRKKIAPTKLSVDDILPEYIENSKMIYTSGITQSLSVSAREAVRKSFELAHELGVQTAYDPNFIPEISSADDAKEYFDEVIQNTDILFMSTKRDFQLLGIESIDSAIKFLWDKGVSVAVVKSSRDNGYYTGYNGNISFTEFYTHDVIDTTCSGDAFNGGFLHAVLHGYNSIEATRFASIVAGLQAKGIGAIKSIPYAEEVNLILKGE